MTPDNRMNLLLEAEMLAREVFEDLDTGTTECPECGINAHLNHREAMWADLMEGAINRLERVRREMEKKERKAKKEGGTE